MCELTNQQSLGIWEGGFKGTERFGQMENTMMKLMCFLSIKACKLILLVKQNKIRNLKMSIIRIL